jgi:hypothetical protein
VTEHTFLHTVRTANGVVVATLRWVRNEGATRCEWRDGSGALVLIARVDGLGSTQVLDSGGREIAGSDCRADQPKEPTVRLIGSSGVVWSRQVDGHPLWIVEDYGNSSRHFVFGCGPDCFLHAHLDARGAVTLTEKSHEHATRRTVRRNTTGALLTDEAVVQPGESVEDIARRCGLAPDALRAGNNLPSIALLAPGSLVRLA